MIQDVVRQVRFQNAEGVGCWNRAQRNGVLLRIRIDRNVEILMGKICEQGWRIAVSAWRMLIFAAKIKCKAAQFTTCAEARVVVEAFLIRAPVIIGDRLPEMEAVAERGTADASQLRIGAFEFSVCSVR